MSLSTALVVFLILILTFYNFFRKTWKNAPPGPRGVPIAGNIFQLDTKAWITAAKWAKKFGPIFKVELAGVKVVVVSDCMLLRQIFSLPVFSGRIDFRMFDPMQNGKVHGVVNTEGPYWEEQRRFIMKQFREYGHGKDTMALDVQDLVESLRETKGQPVTNVRHRVQSAMLNSMWWMICGERRDLRDLTHVDMLNEVNDGFARTVETALIIEFAPWVGTWFPGLTGYGQMNRALLQLKGNVQKFIDEYKATYSPDVTRGYIDSLLKLNATEQNPDSVFFGDKGNDQILGLISDMWLAATESPPIVLTFLILYLAKFPEVQKNFQKEIEEVTGNTRPVTLEDRRRMPYTEAVIEETLRFAQTAPFGVPHRTLEDTTFGKYFFPKNTVVAANMAFMHSDADIWGDPHNFRPERFLSEDGTKCIRSDKLISFSVGRRHCFGETLGRDSVFLFGANICQQFDIVFDKNGPDNGLEKVIAMVCWPKDFHVFFKERLH